MSDHPPRDGAGRGLRRGQHDRRRPRAVPRRTSAAPPSASPDGRGRHRRTPRARRARDRAAATVAGDPRSARRALRGLARRQFRTVPRRRPGSRPVRPPPRAMLTDRADDGRYGPFRFTCGEDPASGARRRRLSRAATRSPGSRRSSRSCSRARRSSGRRGRTTSTSGAYAKEYNEVKSLGAVGEPAQPPSRRRSPGSYTAHPVEMYNRTFRTIAEDAGAHARRAGPALRDAEPGRGGRV